MKYEFKVNGRVFEPTEISHLDLEKEEYQELLETGSVVVKNIFDAGSGDATITLSKVIDNKSNQKQVLDKTTIKLVLYSTLNYLLLDSPDGTLPKKYARVFQILGKQLVDLELNYDGILDELIDLLGDKL